jgi:hypothetical protein
MVTIDHNLNHSAMNMAAIDWNRNKSAGKMVTTDQKPEPVSWEYGNYRPET